MKFSRAGTAGFVSLILFWFFFSKTMSPLAMASPGQAVAAAWSMAMDKEFVLSHMAVTLYRVLLALAAGSLAGFFLGLAAGRSRWVMDFLEPFRRILTGIPGIVAAVLAMLWFGLGSVMAVFLAGIFIIPVVYLNVAESIRQCDRKHMETARVYRLPFRYRLQYIFIPMVGASLASSLAIVTGSSMRLVILSEVLGAGNGLGYILSLSRTRLDMPGLYGCVLLCLVFVWLGELIIKKLLFRWCHG